MISKNKMMFWTLNLSLSLLAGNAFAQGQGTGNGGLGFVCRDSSGTVTSAVLADFYESENDPTIGYKIQRSSLPWKDQLISAIETKIPSASLTVDSKFFYKKMMASIRPLNRGVGLVRPGGSENTITVTHPHCPLEVIALHKQGLIAINQDIFDKFSETDKAGLYLHELFYWVGRANKNLATSDPLRPVVAATFSGDSIDTSLGGIFNQRLLALLSFYEKHSSWESFAIYRESENVVSKLYFGLNGSDRHRSIEFNVDLGYLYTVEIHKTLGHYPLASGHDLLTFAGLPNFSGSAIVLTQTSGPLPEWNILFSMETKGSGNVEHYEPNLGLEFLTAQSKQVIWLEKRIVYGNAWK